MKTKKIAYPEGRHDQENTRTINRFRKLARQNLRLQDDVIGASEECVDLRAKNGALQEKLNRIIATNRCLINGLFEILDIHDPQAWFLMDIDNISIEEFLAIVRTAAKNQALDLEATRRESRDGWKLYNELISGDTPDQNDSPCN